MSYEPKSINTASIALTGGLTALTERLAENTRDLCVTTRPSQGWTHSPQRGDAAKKHSYVIPCDDLPESEKTYGRETVLNTIIAILALGYTIQPTPIQ